MEHCVCSFLSPFKLNKSHITALKWQDLKPQFVETPKLNMNSQWRGGHSNEGEQPPSYHQEQERNQLAVIMLLRNHP